MGKKVRPWKSIRPPSLSPETAETANATEHTVQTENNLKNGKRVKIALIGAVAIAGIAAALSLGGNKTPTPPQEPEVEDVIDNTEPNYTDTNEEDIASTNDNSTTDGPYDDPFLNEFMELYVNDRIDEGNSIVLDSPGEEEVEEYDDSLTVNKILDALEYNSLSNAISDDPERVAGYIRRWMIDNGYPFAVADDIVYDSGEALLSIHTDYNISNSLNGSVYIENARSQNTPNIRISNLSDPSNPQYFEYQSNEIPNYDALLQIAQEHLG